jgi:PASTA domain/PEP-CTERM motif
LARSVAVITAHVQGGGVSAATVRRGWNGGLGGLAWDSRRTVTSPSVTAACIGLLVALLAVALSPTLGTAGPITGDSHVGRGPLITGVTVSCGLNSDGSTTCAVQRGRAAVCPERVPGQQLERSYLSYEYLQVKGGCTLPVDYWRAHSRKGSAPFDDVWDRLGSGGKAQFFNAPESYEQILAGGVQDGPYYRLAKAYVAAELNSVNGAPFSDAASAAFEQATGLFLAAKPDQLEAEAAPRFAALAATLEQFNAGAAGPGACPALPEPFSSADLGALLQGAESRDAGTVSSVDQRYGRGGGVLTIQPRADSDKFLLPDEPFTVAGMRKAKFTTALADCVNVPAGQQTTVAEGGLPSPPQLTTAEFLDQERLMRMIVAVAESAEAEQIAPGAGPTTTTATTAPALPASSAMGGGTSAGTFPSVSLPSVAAGAGGGEDSMLVPNVIGTTVGEARRMIEGAGLSVGNVTVTQRQALLDGIIRVAWALDEMIVIAQHPDPGTLVSAVDPPPIDLEAEAPPQAIPEPASLLLFATGLAFIAIAMARRRA